MTEKEALAYHEAGHAIVAMKLGYRCHWVAIEPEPRTCCDEPVEHALQILIAARVSERKHTKAPEIWRDQDDKQKAVNLALWATNGDTEKAGDLLNEMLAEACASVDQHWGAIEQLAQDLLIKKKITFVAQEPKQHPETLAEAIEWANQHQRVTGESVETVPNSEQGIYFNIIDRTVTRLQWDEAGKVVEVTTSCDTGHILGRRVLEG